MQVDACLKEREVYDFTTADFEQDRETLRSFERERLSTELALDMVVVADTSQINYLVLIARIDLPAGLYTRMLIPPAVLAELKHPVATENRTRVGLQCARVVGSFESHARSDPSIARPDESEAIGLATEVLAEVVLMDEQAGRQETLRRDLKVAGRLSILGEADQAGFVVFDDAVAEMRKTSFRLSQAVLSEIRQKRSRERRLSSPSTSPTPLADRIAIV
jgi:predicted nucleic acid-binding protein